MGRGERPLEKSALLATLGFCNRQRAFAGPPAQTFPFVTLTSSRRKLPMRLWSKSRRSGGGEDGRSARVSEDVQIDRGKQGGDRDLAEWNRPRVDRGPLGSVSLHRQVRRWPLCPMPSTAVCRCERQSLRRRRPSPCPRRHFSCPCRIPRESARLDDRAGTFSVLPKLDQ